MSLANVYSEFQPLEEVIVGRSYTPAHAQDLQDIDLRHMLERIFLETEEDLLTLIKFLESQNVTVRRPEVLFDLKKNSDAQGKYRPRVDLHQFGFSFPNQPLMPRDTAGIYGSTILEFYTKNTGRFFDNWSTYDIFRDYFKSGAKWISMPPPLLSRQDVTYSHENQRLLLFHAANFLKCGKDIFYSQPGSSFGNGKGTDLGLQWVKQVLGESFRFHPVNAGGHLDGKMAILKPGVVACWDPKIIPEAMKNWSVIQIPATWGKLPEEFLNIRKQRFYKEFVEKWLTEWIGYCDESVFDVNMLSINENLVVTNGYNKEVYEQFKKHGIEGWPFHFRHQHFWDGAVHCLTLDVRRKGNQEDYF